MKKAKWLRGLALCMAVICLVTCVGALSYDLNGDGKTDVWDLQLAVNEGKTDTYADALAEALGGKDELHPNAEGVYEIYTSLGLYNMANLTNAGKDAQKTFKLMKDIDMEGAAWYPTETFNGVFEGDGHVISNVNVCGEVRLSSTACGQGFFGKIGQNGAVRNLKLENVNVILTEDSQANFIGLLTGSSTGEITNCTTVGTVIDPRTTLSATTYIGTLTGRIEKASYTVPGICITDESVLMTAESAEVAAISGKSQKVLCKMGMEFAALESGSKSRKLGIAGWAPNYDSFKAYNWQDISGACQVVGGTGKTYNLEDPILTARRQAVVDKMYEICTVQWTPSQDMTLYYYKNVTGEPDKLNYSTKTWKAGTTYYGMPYNHGSGSLERFEAWMQEGTDSSGRLVTKTTLPTESYYYTYSPIRTALSNYTDTSLQTPLTFTDTETGKTYDLLPGFTVSDQPLQVGEQVESADHAGFSRYVGNDCSQAIAWAWREVVSCDVKNGGTVISGVTQMCPLTTYQTRYGVLPVGGLVPSAYTVAAVDTMYTEKGKDAFMNAYAQASRGDGLIVAQTAGGHSRMIAYDPICIYTFDETSKKYVIDSANSYLITHEQGGTSKSGYNTTCNWNRVLTFDALLDDNDHVNNNADGKGVQCAHYFPMTLPAFHDVDNKAVTSTVSLSGTTIKSNFYIVSTTVDGNEVFNSVGQHKSTNTTTRVGSGYRDAHVQTDVAALHGDVAGKAVTVKLSNGDVYRVYPSTGVVAKVPNTEIGGEGDSGSSTELSKEALNGKKVIFFGNSRTYYGKCVLDKGQTVFSQEKRTGDQGYFYQICKANGVDVTVTNFTFGAHNLDDFYTGSCAADRGHDGHNHLEDLVDRNYDYVVLQQGSSSDMTNILDQCQPMMDIFLEENPDTKFVFLVTDAVHSSNYAWRSSIKELEEAGIIVVDWGAMVNDLITGTEQIPGGTQQCSKYSFIVNKSASDGYHPNVLTGYITAQMLFCALTGESAQGQDYAFWNDAQVNKSFDMDAYMETYYKYDATVDSNTNFMDIFNSEADMAGIQQLIDKYLAEKGYREY